MWTYKDSRSPTTSQYIAQDDFPHLGLVFTSSMFRDLQQIPASIQSNRPNVAAGNVKIFTIPCSRIETNPSRVEWAQKSCYDRPRLLRDESGLTWIYDLHTLYRVLEKWLAIWSYTACTCVSSWIWGSKSAGIVIAKTLFMLKVEGSQLAKYHANPISSSRILLNLLPSNSGNGTKFLGSSVVITRGIPLEEFWKGVEVQRQGLTKYR